MSAGLAGLSGAVGDDTDVIIDKGDIQMAAWGTANIHNQASATTYGLAGASSGDVTVFYNGTTTVEPGQNVRLEASDGLNPVDGSAPSSASIKLSAGKDLTGTGTVRIDGLVDTGLQRFKTVQIKYSDVDYQQSLYSLTTCTVTATACIAEPKATDNIAFTITGATANAAITTNLTTIATDNTNMAVSAQTAINRANSAKSSISALAAALSGNGSLTLATKAIAQIADQKSIITTGSIAMATRITALKVAASGTATIATAPSVADFEALLIGFSQSLGNNTATFNSASNLITGPMQPEVVVPDTVARLGNIFINADNLVGTGKVAAPGDARILVENFTAAFLLSCAPDRYGSRSSTATRHRTSS